MLKPKIAVLMSSYNGEKYIREQIESILAQKDVDITLYVRDDGSTDDTVGIIRSYLKNGNVKLLVDGKNLRPGLSFLTLLKKVVKSETEYDYFAFADQDDIWLDEKLISAVEMIKESEKPALYCSNQFLYKNGQNEGLRFTDEPDLSLLGHVSNNDIYGCTMVFDYSIGKKVVESPIPSKSYLDSRCHDSWVFIVSLIFGNVFYDSRSYILYRIHESNTVGIKERTLSQRVRRFFKGDIRNIRQECAKLILDVFPTVDFPDRCYVEKIAYYKKSFRNRISLMLNTNKCKGRRERKFDYILKVIMGLV